MSFEDLEGILQDGLAEKEARNRQREANRELMDYAAHPSLSTLICYYCGNKANTEDHFPPVTVRKLWPNMPRVRVRCCEECNRRLSNSMQVSLEVRKQVADELRNWQTFLLARNWEMAGKEKMFIGLGRFQGLWEMRNDPDYTERRKRKRLRADDKT